MKPITFALFFGNRGFFPGELIADARKELADAVTKAGYQYIMMDETETRYGAVETIEEGEKYAKFLDEHRGEYQGVILCLPNFGDENGAMVALRNCGVPILVQAYPDEIGKMDFAHRRDALCGKLAMCNVLRQCKLPYTIFRPYTVHPSSDEFANQIEKFAGICRIVSGMKTMSVGAIGARTTAFKSVRIDEIALENAGITMETIDLSEVVRRMSSVDSDRIEKKVEDYLKITVFKGFPEEKLRTIAKVGVVVDDLIQEYRLDAVAIRCWNELELLHGVAPCLILCELNERGIPAACEVDISNAIMMKAISLAAKCPAMLLDINNNYGEDPEKSILFHCGPVPASLMEGKGETIEHKMFAKSFGPGSGVGVNRAKIRTGHVTYGSVCTHDGKIHAFVGEGDLTDDPLEEQFFGSGIVMHSATNQDLLEYASLNGYRHHLSLTAGSCSDVVYEALTKYLGYVVHKI